MRVLVCGNRATHEWPETCVRNLERLGHEVELLYYRTLRQRDRDELLTAELREAAPQLLETYEGTRALMEVAFYNLAATWRPDVILLAGMYHTWTADALADVRETVGCPVVLWSGDDPYEPWATDVLTPAPYYDHALFTIWGLAERAAADFPSVGFLPFACDPARDRVPVPPSPDHARFRCDVSYLGTMKLDRADLLEPLAASGVDLGVWGEGFAEDVEATHPALARARRPGRVQGEQARALYAASEVVLNLHHKGFGNMKFYEVASCGSFQVSNLRRDAEAILPVLPFVEKVAVYEDPAELPGLVQHWLERPAERARVARELQAVVRAEHTWEHRLRALLELAVPRPVPRPGPTLAPDLAPVPPPGFPGGQP